MRTIHKYEIKTSFTLTLPATWKPLMIAEQRGVPCLWVELDTEGQPWRHTFQVFGTGHELPDFGSHIGSWQSGPFVWHLYQLGSTKAELANKER